MLAQEAWLTKKLNSEKEDKALEPLPSTKMVERPPSKMEVRKKIKVALQPMPSTAAVVRLKLAPWIRHLLVKT